MTITRPPQHTVRYDNRYDNRMVPCANQACRNTFTPSGRRRYCSNACKQATYRDLHPNPPTETPPPPTTRPSIVYECPTCDTRYLDQQRCDDCNTFCRRLGPGAPCPHCDQPITQTDLQP